MSGGHFNDNGYDYYKVFQFADELESEISNNEIEREGYCPGYSGAVLNELKKQLPRIRQIAEVMHHIDYLYSGDYGEDTFLDHMRSMRELNPQQCAEIEAYGNGIGVIGLTLEDIIRSHRTLREKNREFYAGRSEGYEEGYKVGLARAEANVKEDTLYLENVRKMTVQELANLIGTED